MTEELLGIERVLGRHESRKMVRCKLMFRYQNRWDMTVRVRVRVNAAHCIPISGPSCVNHVIKLAVR